MPSRPPTPGSNRLHWDFKDPYYAIPIMAIRTTHSQAVPNAAMDLYLRIQEKILYEVD